MTELIRVRVTMNGDQPKYELMLDGVKVGDLTRSDVLELILQFLSSLRWEK